MTEEKARQLFEDVRKLHTPDRPTVTSELALREPQAQSARCSVAPGSAEISDILRDVETLWGNDPRFCSENELALKQLVAHVRECHDLIRDMAQLVSTDRGDYFRQWAETIVGPLPNT